MGKTKRIESTIQQFIWKITRSTDIIKYVPKRIKKGVVIGDCAVLRDSSSISIYSKARQPIVQDLSSHKVAICIATLMNQYTPKHSKTVKELKALDREHAMVFNEHYRLKHKKKADTDVIEFLEDRLTIIKEKIDYYYDAMTI
jgi:hypothetical protein